MLTACESQLVKLFTSDLYGDAVIEAKETGPKRAKCFENDAEPKDSPVRYKSTDFQRMHTKKLRSLNIFWVFDGVL